MVNKDRILNDSLLDWLRSVPAVRWLFLLANIVVNFGLTIVAVGIFVPWLVYFIMQTISDNSGTIPLRYFLTELNTNSPWAILLVIPVAVMSLIFPLFGKPKFLILLRGFQSVAAWNQTALALATVMWLGRLTLYYYRIDHVTIPFFIYFGFATSLVLLFQAVCMAALAFASWFGHLRIVQKNLDKQGEISKNRDYKILAAAYQIFDAILVVVFAVYVGLQLYEYFSRPADFHTGFEKTFFEIPLVVIFGIGCIVNFVGSIVCASLFVYTLITKNYNRTFSLGIVAYDSVAFLAYLIVFVGVCGMLLLVTFLIGTPPVFPFFHSLFAIGALGLFKIIPFLESLDVAISNAKLNIIKAEDLSMSFLRDI